MSLVAYALLKGFLYARPPLPSEIIPFFQAHPEPDKALEEAQLALLNEYAESVDHNFKQNARRSYVLLQSQRAAFFALLLLILSAPRWIYNLIQFIPEPQSVKIVAPIEIVKEKSMPTSTAPAAAMPQPIQNQGQTPTSAVPAPPVFSPNPQIRPPFPTRKMVLDSATETPPPPKNKQ